MTCIFFCKTRLYTDTKYVKDGETFLSMTKVKRLKEPLVVEWKPREGIDQVQSLYPEHFTDSIHGYVVTGANQPADVFMWRLIAVKGDIDALYEQYFHVMKGKLVTGDNHFTIILIGEKADYAFSLDYDIVSLRVHPRDDPFAYGTGGDAAMKEWVRTDDPIRAMYSAYWIDEQSGGVTDIWDLPTVEFPYLNRTGICNNRSYSELKDILNAKIEGPIQPDFISQALSNALMEGAGLVGEHLGELRALGYAEPRKDSLPPSLAEAYAHPKVKLPPKPPKKKVPRK